MIENEIKQLRKRLNTVIIPDETSIINSIESEITDYFDQRKFIFNTPIHLVSSSFQKNVLDENRLKMINNLINNKLIRVVIT